MTESFLDMLRYSFFHILLLCSCIANLSVFLLTNPRITLRLNQEQKQNATWAPDTSDAATKRETAEGAAALGLGAKHKVLPAFTRSSGTADDKDEIMQQANQGLRNTFKKVTLSSVEPNSFRFYISTRLL